MLFVCVTITIMNKNYKSNSNIKPKKTKPNIKIIVIVSILFLLMITLTVSFFVINNVARKQTYTSPASTVGVDTQVNTATVMKNVKWGDDIEVSFEDGLIRLQANGIPNHKRDAQYAVPNAQIVIPTADTAHITKDPTRAQSYDFKITATPKLAPTVTQAPLGSIGLMISGSVLFNPYEGDNKTVAMSNNFYLTDKNGNKVWFVDSCNAHPTPSPGGEYHYHALSGCVTSEVDTENGPSHITGIALDGFPIYGNRDINGNKIDASKLDECNGINSPTPEFPNGIYHYVLPGTTDATSSIRCFKGEVDTSQLMKMPPMN